MIFSTVGDALLAASSVQSSCMNRLAVVGTLPLTTILEVVPDAMHARG